MSNTEAIKSAMEAFLAEDEKFEAGNGAAGTRARKALQEMTKAIKERRKEITDTKNARKAEKMGGYCVKFNLDDLLKADSKSRGEYIRNLFNVGALSVDEIRLMEGLVPLNSTGSGKHWVQVNMADIDSEINENNENE